MTKKKILIVGAVEIAMGITAAVIATHKPLAIGSIGGPIMIGDSFRDYEKITVEPVSFLNSESIVIPTPEDLEVEL